MDYSKKRELYLYFKNISFERIMFQKTGVFEAKQD